MGGAGSAVAEALAAAGVTIPLLHLGLPDRFIDHGDPASCWPHCGLDAAGIVAAVDARFAHRRAACGREACGMTSLRDDRTRPTMNRPGTPAQPLPIPDVQSGARRAQSRDRPGRHPRAALSAELRRCRRRRAADDRDLQRLRRAARRPQGHAHVALRRAARVAQRARRAGAVRRDALAISSTRCSCCSRRRAGASSSRSRISSARRRRCRASRACSTTRCACVGERIGRRIPADARGRGPGHVALPVLEGNLGLRRAQPALADHDHRARARRRCSSRT